MTEQTERELNAKLDLVQARLDELIRMVAQPAEPPRLWYTTQEAAKELGKAAFTTREWARQGRIRAEKRRCGRGASTEWMISAEEVRRIREHGLLPARPVIPSRA